MSARAIHGTYFDGKTSHGRPCTLERQGDAVHVRLDGDNRIVALSDLTFSPRIGKTARFVTFPDGGVFESLDNDAIDELLPSSPTHQRQQSISRWERSFGWIGLSLVAVVGLVYFILMVAIPAFSEEVAHALPVSVSEKIAANVLADLDEQVLGKSALPTERQEELRRQFDDLASGVKDFHLKIEFRHGNEIDANAFALPDGTVVITDELVALAKDDHEIQSVLLHEIGHVVHRHALRGLIEHAGTAILAVWLTGDIDVGSNWITLLPAILLQSSYSRDKELEADTYALSQLHQRDLSPRYFAQLLRSLMAHKTTPRASDEDKATGTDEKGRVGAQEYRKWLDYISSHPTTEARIERFEQAENGGMENP